MTDKRMYVVIFSAIILIGVLYYGFTLAPTYVLMGEISDEPVFTFSPETASEISSYISSRANLCSYGRSTELWAAIKGDPDICNTENTSEGISKCMDSYYFFTSVYGKDVCSMISEDYYRILCNAVVNNDSSLCEGINHDSNKYREICSGIINEDVSVCSQIYGDESIKCSNIVRMFISSKSNDITGCDYMADYPGDETFSQREFCRLFIQRDRYVNTELEALSDECEKQLFREIDYRKIRDTFSCNSIILEDAKTECEAVVYNDSDRCSGINDKSLKFRCYYQILGKNGLQLLCSEIPEICNQPDT